MQPREVLWQLLAEPSRKNAEAIFELGRRDGRSDVEVVFRLATLANSQVLCN